MNKYQLKAASRRLADDLEEMMSALMTISALDIDGMLSVVHARVKEGHPEGEFHEQVMRDTVHILENAKVVQKAVEEMRRNTDDLPSMRRVHSAKVAFAGSVEDLLDMLGGRAKKKGEDDGNIH